MNSLLFKSSVAALSLLLIFFGLIPAGLACELSNASSWFWSEERLVKDTTDIFLVKIVKHSSENDFDTDYEAKIIEVLKTAEPKIYSPGASVTLSKFAPPSFNPREWDRKRGRAIHSKACKIISSFEDGKSYLIFYKSFHPKGYEEVKYPDADPWYQLVKKWLKR